MAESNGYVVDKVFQVWHYPESAEYNPETQNGGLFSDYINTKLRQVDYPPTSRMRLILNGEKNCYRSILTTSTIEKVSLIFFAVFFYYFCSVLQQGNN